MISRLQFIHPKVTRKYVFYKAFVRITSAYRIHQSAIIIASTIGKDVLLVVQQPPTPTICQTLLSIEKEPLDGN